VHFLHIANSDKPVAFYSLDVILAVGYRTNSSKAIEFRKWATNVLKEFLINGYAVNEKRLLQVEQKFNELNNTIAYIKDKSSNELLSNQQQELLSLLSNYSKTLSLLVQYDKNNLPLIKKAKEEYEINPADAFNVIKKLREDLISKKEASEIFGQERDNNFKAILGNIYQTFGGIDLYSSLEEKAAHLLYFIIKDHPFNDGNKRIGAFLFVYYLDRNNFLFKKSGEKKINDNALATLALLIAISSPNEKDKMIKIVTNLLSA
jgi:death-on-curing family protein